MTLFWRDLTSSRRARWPAVRGAMPRPRLLAALEGARAVVVVAAAGYGKTTALASLGTQLAETQAWLTLDADDADPQVLAASLAVAAEALPGGEVVGKLLDAGASPRRVVTRLVDLLDSTRSILVIDEAHHLFEALSRDLLTELLHIGEGRVALLSRVPVPLSELAKLEAAGEVRRLSAADLAFTPEETQMLLRSAGLNVGLGEARLAHAVTEGWPIAARFLAQAAAQGRVSLRTLAELDGGEAQLGTLFSYLAQEVLQPLEPALRQLLTRGSVFEELTPELVSEVLEEPAAFPLLEALGSSGTFLIRSSSAEVYRAHPLLRAHLRGILPPAEAQAIAARGAAYFERTGRPRRALAAHLMAGNQAQAAALLARHGASWLDTGRAALVERSLGRLPRSAWTPELHALAGDALRLSSRYAEALREYAQSTPLGRALGEVRVALDTVQPDLGWEALALAEQLAQPEHQALVRRLRAENLLNAGRLSEAVALEPELAAGARYALRSGDLERAFSLARQAAHGELGGARAAQNHREGLLLASFISAVMGDPAATEYAQAGLAEGERLESPFVRSLALARLGHAQHVAGAAGAAQATYTGALNVAEGVAGRLRVEPLMGLAFLAFRQGHLVQGEAHYREALAQTAGDSYMMGLLHLSAALGKFQAGLLDDAKFQAARAAFSSTGDAFGLAAVTLAQVAAGLLPEQSGVEAVIRYPFLLGQPAFLAPYRDPAQRAALLARVAASAPERLSEFQPVAQALGYPAVPTLQDVAGFTCTVQVLGRIQVTRAGDGRSREWGRAKARDLLALLVVHQAGLARSAAQELLFPGADPGIGDRNFRVTLHALAQVLEEGAPSGVFLERGDWLRLRQKPDLRVDLWEAQQALNAEVGSPGRLAALLALPSQLADSDLSDVQQEAERYATHLPEALAEEAEYALNAGLSEQAGRAAEHSLELDPLHEPAARVLMRVYHARGNTAAAQRVFLALQQALSEYDLVPLPETEALRRALRL